MRNVLAVVFAAMLVLTSPALAQAQTAEPAPQGGTGALEEPPPPPAEQDAGQAQYVPADPGCAQYGCDPGGGVSEPPPPEEVPPPPEETPPVEEVPPSPADETPPPAAPPGSQGPECEQYGCGEPSVPPGCQAYEFQYGYGCPVLGGSDDVYTCAGGYEYDLVTGEYVYEELCFAGGSGESFGGGTSQPVSGIAEDAAENTVPTVNEVDGQSSGSQESNGVVTIGEGRPVRAGEEAEDLRPLRTVPELELASEGVEPAEDGNVPAGTPGTYAPAAYDPPGPRPGYAAYGPSAYGAPAAGYEAAYEPQAPGVQARALEGRRFEADAREEAGRGGGGAPAGVAPSRAGEGEAAAEDITEARAEGRNAVAARTGGDVAGEDAAARAGEDAADEDAQGEGADAGERGDDGDAANGGGPPRDGTGGGGVGAAVGETQGERPAGDAGEPRVVLAASRASDAPASSGGLEAAVGGAEEDSSPIGTDRTGAAVGIGLVLLVLAVLGGAVVRRRVFGR